MNGQQLYDLTTKLLGDLEMDQELFVSLLNMAKKSREGIRQWTWLLKRDTSIVHSAGDNATVAKTTPANFVRPIKQTDKKSPIRFLNASGKPSGDAREIPLDRQDEYEGRGDKFFIDYGDAAKPLYFTGPGNGQTAALYYVRKTADIALADLVVPDADAPGVWTWDYIPAEYHPLLAYDIAIMHKGDVDFDDVNEGMIKYAGLSVSKLEFAMRSEDDQIKLSTLEV